MQNLSKVFKNKTTGWLLLLTLLASCTTVYFDKPVPQSGSNLTSFSADLTGLYLAEPAAGEAPAPFETMFRQCFRLERIGTRQLLVSAEYRIHQHDIPKLKAELEKQKRAGRLKTYHLSETMLLSTTETEDGNEEQQYCALVKQGDWYTLAQSIIPFRLFDLETGAQKEFEREKNTTLQTSILPEATSISSNTSSLVARKDRKGWYFNIKQADATKWSLLYVEQTAKDRLTIKSSQLENPDDFKNRFDYFNAITPFGEAESDRFEINPDDAALARLLAEEGFFQTMRLRKIGE